MENKNNNVNAHLIPNLLVSFLGKRKDNNVSNIQLRFDCPNCSELKGLDDGDGKGNLEVSTIKGKYNCWSCGEEYGTRGSLRSLIKRYGTKANLSFYDSLNLEFEGDDRDKVLEQKSKAKKKIETLSLPEEFIHWREYNENDISHRIAINYLRQDRKISEKILDKYNIGFCDRGKYSGRIVIPSYDKNGKLNYYVTRSYLDHKNKYDNVDILKTEIIFNEKFINFDEDIFIVEGPFDHIVTENSFLLLGKDLPTEKKMLLYRKSKKI